MDVPFKALLDYCFLSLPKTLHIESIDRLKEDLHEKSGNRKDSIKNYRNGNRSGYDDVAPNIVWFKVSFSSHETGWIPGELFAISTDPMK